MRITIEIPTKLYRDLERKAAEEGATLQEIIVRVVEKELQSSNKIKLPIIPTKEPGTLDLDNDRIYDLIDFP